MKQFNTKAALEKWIEKNFQRERNGVLDIDIPLDLEKVEEKLIADGYDIENLVKNGHAYDINGHANNGWLFDDEVCEEFSDNLKAEGKIIKRNSILGKRMETGLSRAEMSRQFKIPIRTLENWDGGVSNPPEWAEILIIEKLNWIKEQNEKEI